MGTTIENRNGVIIQGNQVVHKGREDSPKRNLQKQIFRIEGAIKHLTHCASIQAKDGQGNPIAADPHTEHLAVLNAELSELKAKLQQLG
jgi:hypothetical protein